MKKLNTLLMIAMLSLAGCANDATYRMRDPKTCISTGVNGCTEKQASANRVVFFEQCKALYGTPSLKYVDVNLAPSLVMGFNCLMPDGSVRDLYAEKFEKDTGKKVSN
jgi:hypothetical protein